MELEALTEEHPYRFLIHDRDSIFSSDLDKAVTAMGVQVRKTPVRAPKANAVCERLVGTIRRECLDFLIPFGERHLKQVLTNWVAYYNHARVIFSTCGIISTSFCAAMSSSSAGASFASKWGPADCRYSDRSAGRDSSWLRVTSSSSKVAIKGAA